MSDVINLTDNSQAMKFAGIPLLIMMMSMFPYLPGGIRLENIVLPLLTFWVFITAFRSKIRVNYFFVSAIFSLFISIRINQGKLSIDD